MKVALKAILITTLVITSVYLFRGFVYRKIVSYEQISERKNYEVKLPELHKLIADNNASVLSTPFSIINQSLVITSDALRFTGGKNDVDPNKLIVTKNAHCVGYAAFFATVCNQFFQLNDLSNEWAATPQKGELFLMGVSVHPYFHSPFFRDHDFVIIKNLKSGEELAVDPSLHDYTGIRYITLRK